MIFSNFFKSSDNNKRKVGKGNPEDIAVIFATHKAKEAENIGAVQIFQWLEYTMRNGGNSDHVLIATIKGYFAKQRAKKFPAYKVLTDSFLNKVDKFANEYFKLKDVPIMYNPSIISQVVSKINESSNNNKSRDGHILDIDQRKKIVMDSMEAFVKETEGMVQTMKDLFLEGKLFSDEEITEYNKVATNLTDSSTRFASIISKYAEKIFFHQTGR